MSRVHKSVQTLKSAAPWYYRPLVYWYRIAKFPMKLWRRYRRELVPVLAVQAGKWNSNRIVSRKYAEQQGILPGPVLESDDPFDKFGRMRRGWLYDIPPNRTPQSSYIRPASAPKPTEWKPDA